MFPVEPPEAIQSISAVTLFASDMAAATAFYETLGFVVLYGGPAASFTSFRAGEGFLNLQLDTDRAPVPRTWGRVVFWVGDVDAIYDRARAAGLRPATAPADASWGERYFHIADPDGHELSFARPLRGHRPA